METPEPSRVRFSGGIRWHLGGNPHYRDRFVKHLGCLTAPPGPDLDLMARDGWTRDKALAYVRNPRPIVQPNSAFMELLLEWAKIVSE